MTTDELFELARDTYATLMWADRDGEGPDMADLDGLPIAELDSLISQLGTLSQTVRHLKTAAETRIAGHVGEGGAVRIGDVVYRYRPKHTTRIVNPDGLIRWLGEDWHHVIGVTPSTTLRRGGLKAVCEKRDVDLATITDTFTETEVGDPTVDRIPLDKAPKFLQRLGELETFTPREGAA